MVDIISLLSADGFIICNKKLIKLFGTDAAIILGELCAEYNYYKAMNELSPADSFYSTQENIEENTGINPYFQRKALKVLQEAEIISIHKQGLPAKNYFQINSKRLLEIYSDNSKINSCEASEGLVMQALDINNNKNNKNKNTLSKDNVLYDAETFFSSDVSEEVPKKPKKKNLYQQCLDTIYEYTNDAKLTELLIQYLNFILEKYKHEGKILYVNQWKGMLNKLDEICGAGNCRYGEVVQQSLTKGYVGFFPVNNYSKPKTYVPDTNKAPQHHAGEKVRNEDGTLKEY